MRICFFFKCLFSLNVMIRIWRIKPNIIMHFTLKALVILLRQSLCLLQIWWLTLKSHYTFSNIKARSMILGDNFWILVIGIVENRTLLMLCMCITLLMRGWLWSVTGCGSVGRTCWWTCLRPSSMSWPSSSWWRDWGSQLVTPGRTSMSLLHRSVIIYTLSTEYSWGWEGSEYQQVSIL